MAYKTADILNYDILKQNARENRHNMTEAESALWQYLRSEQLGYKFLRQHVIGDYIVDFLCRKTNLIIEIDGEYHFEGEQQQLDLIRTQWLEERGYRVIRFTNEDILFNIEKTIEIIKNNILWKKEM